MCLGDKEGTWIQCQECGHIYWIDREVPVDILYIASYCPRCDGTKGLNCGNDADEIYLYMNENMDPRFYEY